MEDDHGAKPVAVMFFAPGSRFLCLGSVNQTNDMAPSDRKGAGTLLVPAG